MAPTTSLVSLAALILFTGSGVEAQTLRTITAADPSQLTESTVVCRVEVPLPRSLPPADSGPVVYIMSPCVESPARTDPSSFLPDIQLRVSEPSRGIWVPYDAAAERVIFED